MCQSFDTDINKNVLALAQAHGQIGTRFMVTTTVNYFKGQINSYEKSLETTLPMQKKAPSSFDNFNN